MQLLLCPNQISMIFKNNTLEEANLIRRQFNSVAKIFNVERELRVRKEEGEEI